MHTHGQLSGKSAVRHVQAYHADGICIVLYDWLVVSWAVANSWFVVGLMVIVANHILIQFSQCIVIL